MVCGKMCKVASCRERGIKAARSSRRGISSMCVSKAERCAKLSGERLWSKYKSWCVLYVGGVVVGVGGSGWHGGQ